MKEKGGCFLCCGFLIPSMKCLTLRMRGSASGFAYPHPERHCQWHAGMPVKPLFSLPLPRPGLESITDRVTLSDYEARRLLNALVKEFIQMTAEELEQASEGNR